MDRVQRSVVHHLGQAGLLLDLELQADALPGLVGFHWGFASPLGESVVVVVGGAGGAGGGGRSATKGGRRG